MKKPLLIIAAGGTGGHMFPAQALAEAMLDKGWRVRLSTDVRGSRYTGGFPDAIDIEVVRSATFAHKGLLSKVMVPLKLLGGCMSSAYSMMKERPAIVVGFGGYPAIPAMSAACLLRVPRMLHEQNGVLGRVNQLFARFVNKMACGTWPIVLPSGVEAIHTGNPVRRAVLEKAGAHYEAPGLDQISIVVIGGSQGARILSDVVPEAIAQLPSEMLQYIHVSQQARPEDMERVQAVYERNGINADVQSFFSDIPERLAQAQLLISRSGASTVADTAVIGRPAIWVPLAAALRGEQLANIQALLADGASVCVEEADFHVQPVAQHIEAILSAPERAKKMAQKTLAHGRPDATQCLLKQVEALANVS